MASSGPSVLVPGNTTVSSPCLTSMPPFTSFLPLGQLDPYQLQENRLAHGTASLRTRLVGMVVNRKSETPVPPFCQALGQNCARLLWDTSSRISGKARW